MRISLIICLLREMRKNPRVVGMKNSCILERDIKKNPHTIHRMRILILLLKEFTSPHGHHYIIAGLALFIRHDTSIHRLTIHGDGFHALFHIVGI